MDNSAVAETDFAQLVLIWLIVGLITGSIAKLTMQRSFVRWALYGFLLSPIALIHLLVIGLNSNQLSGKIGSVLLVIVVGALGYWIYEWSTGFQPEDIDNIKKSITTEFEKDTGTKVIEVTIIKETNKKLIGFVKLNYLGVEVTRNCEVNMGTDQQYIWRCQ